VTPDEDAVTQYVRRLAATIDATPEHMNPDALRLLTALARRHLVEPAPEWKTHGGISILHIGYHRATVVYWSRRQTKDIPAGWCWQIDRSGVPQAIGPGFNTEETARRNAETALMDLRANMPIPQKAITVMITELRVFTELKEVFDGKGPYSDVCAPYVAAIEQLRDTLTGPNAPDNEIRDAVMNFRHFFGENKPSLDVVLGFTCGEVGVLGDVLDALGETVAAKHWRRAHTSSDDPGGDCYSGCDGDDDL